MGVTSLGQQQANPERQESRTAALEQRSHPYGELFDEASFFALFDDAQ